MLLIPTGLQASRKKYQVFKVVGLSMRRAAMMDWGIEACYDRGTLSQDRLPIQISIEWFGAHWTEDDNYPIEMVPFVTHKVTSISLLERLRDKSDEDAWQRFGDIYGPLIRRWLMQRGVREQDANDVEQEVMQLLLTEITKFDHNGRTGALRCWLRQVVANRLKTFWRQQNRQIDPTGGSDYGAMAEQLEDPSSQFSQLWDAEYHQTVCNRLLDLAKSEFQPQTMDAFRGVAIEEKRASEVAEELGMSANAVRIAQSRVMRRLRELGKGIID